MGGGSLSWQLRVQGGYPPWRGRPSIIRHTHIHFHTHPDWDKVDTPICLKCPSLGCGRKPEYLEKTHTDMGRTCKLQTVAPAWNWFFFSLLWQNDIIQGPAVFYSLSFLLASCLEQSRGSTSCENVLATQVRTRGNRYDSNTPSTFCTYF